MTMNIVITVCYSLISVLLSSAASADVKWKLNSRPELIKEAHHLLKEASQLPDQTGLRRPLYRVNIDVGDKTVTKRVSYIWYYPDTAAVQSYATESVEYNELVEDLTIYEVVVINPKGTLTKFDKKNVQYGDSDRFNIFTHNKNVIFPLPGVEPGSFAVIDYEVKIDKSKLESSWSEIVYTENLYPIDHFDLTVSWLPTNTLNWSQSRDTVICREDTSRLQCSATEIKAAKRDRSVSWSDELGQIVVTEFTNWNQLVEQAFSAFSTAVKNDEKLNPLLEKITNKQEDLAGKIASIHRYVAQDIRYVSISKNGHSITPHSVLQTTKNKYGDCKDKSAVLVSMLKKVGVDAYPVLVATTRNRPDRLVVPAMRYFDHMVVCFQIDGEKYCLDATDSTTDWKTISSWIQGKASLRLLDKEQPQALPSSEFRWKMEIETRLKIDEKGYLQESQVRNYKKEYGSFIRSQLTGINDEEKVKWARDNYKAVVSDQVQPTFEFKDINTLESDLEISSESRYETSFDVTKNLYYTEFDAWIIDEVNSFTIQNEYYDTRFAGLAIQSNYIIDTGQNWEIRWPGADLNMEHEFGSLNRQIQIRDNGKAFVYTKLRIPARLVTASEAESFNKFLGLVKRESTIRLITRKRE